MMKIQLSKIENEVRSTFLDKHTQDMDKKSMVKPLSVIIKKTALEGGYKLANEDHIFMVETLSFDLQHRYKKISMKDVALAFYYGVRGEFGDDHGMSVKNACKWIDRITEIKRKVRVQLDLDNAKKALIEPTNKIDFSSPEAESKSWYDALMNIIKDVGIPMGFPYWRVYLYLESTGEISPEEQEKREFAEKIKRMITLEAYRYKLRYRHENVATYIAKLMAPRNFSEKCRHEYVKRYITKKYKTNGPRTT